MKRIDFFPVWSTVFCYAFVSAASWIVFQVKIAPSAIPADLLIQLVFGCLLYWFSRRRWIFVTTQLLLMSMLYIGNALKLSILGGPLLPDDIHAFPALVLISEGWYRVLLLAPMIAFIGLVIFNLRFSKYGMVAALSVSAALVLTPPHVTVKWMDSVWGNVVWNQPANYGSRGATIYTLQESARYLADREVFADAQAVHAAIQAQTNRLVPVNAWSSMDKRNVHVILLETFWDPSVLTAAEFSQDPLFPEFRELWRETGFTKALSPVFGGYTANAEFEVICGFPVAENRVKFERRFNNHVPCLPKILADSGYRSVASHPNTPAFWNRTNTYRRAGFETFWSRNDFALDDVNGNFLSDTSLYEQVMDKLAFEMRENKPVFNYIVTFFGHLPFPLNDSRPDVVQTSTAVKDVEKYANTVYYKSRELVKFINHLKAVDPDSIIVAFGDHLPFLGFEYAGYVESGVLPKKRENYDFDDFITYTSTPLLVIDGQNGPLKLGNLPLYELPKLILKLLNHTEPTIMDYVQTPPNLLVRALPGVHIDVFADGQGEVCNAMDQSPTCVLSMEWLRRVEIISSDLFMGDQHALPLPALIPIPPDERPSSEPSQASLDREIRESV